MTKYLWLAFGLTISILRGGVSIGGFEVTLGDICLGLILVFNLPRFPRRDKILTCLIALVAISLCSAVLAENKVSALLNLFPFLYAIALFGAIYSAPKHNLKIFINAIILWGVGGAILSFFSGQMGFTIFYPEGSNRFSFLTQNANQWAAYLFSVSLVRMYLTHLNVNDLLISAIKKRGVAISAITLCGAAFTGSKTGLAVIAILFLLEIGITLSTLSFKKLAQIAVLVAIGGAIMPRFADNRIINRATSVFQILGGDKKNMNAKNMEVRAHQYENIDSQLVLRALTLGVGLGNFKEYTGKHEMHNSWASLFIEIGMLGALLYLYISWSAIAPRVTSMSLIAIITFIVMHSTHVYYRERWIWAMLFLLYHLREIESCPRDLH